MTQLIEVFEEETELIIIMELVEGDHMLGFLLKKKQLPEGQIKKLFYGVCLATRAIHAKGMVHRDIKMENILIVEDGTGNPPCKLTDFGLSHFVDKIQSEEFTSIKNCGTPGYIAPELVQAGNYSYSYDIFSLGVVLYIMLTSCFPFAGKDQKEIIRRNLKCKLDYASPKLLELSCEARSLISNMIVRSPTQRLPIDRVLSHNWLQGAFLWEENPSQTQAIQASHTSADIGGNKKSMKTGKTTTTTVKRKSTTRVHEGLKMGISKQSEGKETISEMNYQCLIVQGSSV